jgi:hypothetical protein|nr:MAG TPA: hypothetical protein [Bacteriophage sp.]
MRYYLSNIDKSFAIDKKGNEFYVTKSSLVPAKKGTVDPMWGGITEEEAKKYAWESK